MDNTEKSTEHEVGQAVVDVRQVRKEDVAMVTEGEQMLQPGPENDYLVWIDCEMTGLEPEHDVILEIAVIVTDGFLRVQKKSRAHDTGLNDAGLNIVIHASEIELATMDAYVTQMHTRSGLLEKVRTSVVSVADAQKQVLEYVQLFVPAGVAPLAGNSIGTDRAFLRRWMPELDSYLHYRSVDVSSIKELARRWHPEIYCNKPEKKLLHRALDDIIESIRELAYYRDHMFISSQSPSHT